MPAALRPLHTESGLGSYASTEAEADGTVIRGWLDKSHAGEHHKVSHHRRYVVSRGFHVFYYASPDSKHAHGHFDLRNVVEIGPALPSDAAPQESIRLLIAEIGREQKRIIVAFTTIRGEPSRADWLRSWCSAIDPKYVHASFAAFIDADENISGTIDWDEFTLLYARVKKGEVGQVRVRNPTAQT